MTAFYRAIGAFSQDVHVSIRYVFFGLNVTALFSGYMQPYRSMGSWVYKWIFWATPLSYAQEAVMANQLSGRELRCAPMHLVPNIPGVNIANQGRHDFQGIRMLWANRLQYARWLAPNLVLPLFQVIDTSSTTATLTRTSGATSASSSPSP